MSATADQACRTVVFKDLNVALAISARMTMGHPAFARLPFGEWMGVLAAQAERSHTRFFLDPRDAVVGFFGFALANRAGAEAWTFCGADLSGDAGREGDCIIFNAWVSSHPAVNAVMVDEVRRMGCVAAYFKRFYLDGRVRVVRLPIADPRFPTRNVPRRRAAPQGSKP